MTIRTPSTTRALVRRCLLAALLACGTAPHAFAQTTAVRPPARPGSRPAVQPPGQAPTRAAQPPTSTPAPDPTPSSVSPPADAAGTTQTPADYVIGVDDVLTITFWREKDLNADVTVRPDGMISLTLLNDIRAAGVTSLQLRTAIMEAARKYVTDPNVTVTVKTINSRKIYIAGQVNKPGTFPMIEPMTVLQALAVAGGLVEFAGSENILVVRTENGQTRSLKFNYKDVRRGRKLEQNILLKSGDTIVVP